MVLAYVCVCLSVNGRKMIKINKRLLSSVKRKTRKQFKDLALSLSLSLSGPHDLFTFACLSILMTCPACPLYICVCVCWFNCCLSVATFREVLLGTCNCANKFTWHWTVRLVWLARLPEKERDRERERERRGRRPIPSGNWYSIIERLMKLFGLQQHWLKDRPDQRLSADCKINDLSSLSLALSHSLSAHLLRAKSYCGPWRRL